MAKASQTQGINGSIWSKYRQKKRGGKDAGGKQLKRRATYGSVHCETHGVMPSDGKGFKSVRCAIPITRHERYRLGCPICAEKAKAAKST